jgi:hypothetical protein
VRHDSFPSNFLSPVVTPGNEHIFTEFEQLPAADDCLLAFGSIFGNSKLELGL